MTSQEEEYNFDDLDSMFDNIDSGIDIASNPVNIGSGNPIEKVLVNTKEVITEKLAPEELMSTVSSVAKSALPESVRSSVDQIETIMDKVTEPISSTIKQIRNTAANTVGLIEDAVPEGAIKKYVGKFKNLLKTEEDDYGYSSAPSEEELLQSRVDDAIGFQKTREDIESAIRLNLEQLAIKSQSELLGIIAANSEFNRTYISDMQTRYMQTHLNLEFKQTMYITRIHDLLKASIETSAKQLESIMYNTSLPDYAKLKTSSAITSMGREKLISEGISFFKESDLVKNITNATKRVTDSLSGSLGTILSGADMALENRQMLQDNGIDPMQLLIDDVISNRLETYGKKGFEKLFSRLIESEKGSDFNKRFQVEGVDLHETFKQKRIGNEDKLGTSALDKLRTVAYQLGEDVTRAETQSGISLDNEPLKETALFTNKVSLSITDVIPGLLSKIHTAIEGLRTGKEVDKKGSKELVYDYEARSFKTKKQLGSEFREKAESSFKEFRSGIDKGPIYRLFDRDDVLTDAQKEELIDGVIEYLLEGKSPSPFYLEKNNFFRYFGSKLAPLLKRSFDEVMESNAQSDIDVLRDYIKTSKDIVKNTSKISHVEGIQKLKELGQEDLLKSMKLIDATEDTSVSTKNVIKYNRQFLNIDEARQRELEEEERTLEEERQKRLSTVPETSLMDDFSKERKAVFDKKAEEIKNKLKNINIISMFGGEKKKESLNPSDILTPDVKKEEKPSVLSEFVKKSTMLKDTAINRIKELSEKTPDEEIEDTRLKEPVIVSKKIIPEEQEITAPMLEQFSVQKDKPTLAKDNLKNITDNSYTNTTDKPKEKIDIVSEPTIPSTNKVRIGKLPINKNKSTISMDVLKNSLVNMYKNAVDKVEKEPVVIQLGNFVSDEKKKVQSKIEDYLNDKNIQKAITEADELKQRVISSSTMMADKFIDHEKLKSREKEPRLNPLTPINPRGTEDRLNMTFREKLPVEEPVLGRMKELRDKVIQSGKVTYNKATDKTTLRDMIDSGIGAALKKKEDALSWYGKTMGEAPLEKTRTYLSDKSEDTVNYLKKLTQETDQSYLVPGKQRTLNKQPQLVNGDRILNSLGTPSYKEIGSGLGLLFRESPQGEKLISDKAIEIKDRVLKSGKSTYNKVVDNETLKSMPEPITDRISKVKNASLSRYHDIVADMPSDLIPNVKNRISNTIPELSFNSIFNQGYPESEEDKPINETNSDSNKIDNIDPEKSKFTFKAVREGSSKLFSGIKEAFDEIHNETTGETIEENMEELNKSVNSGNIRDIFTRILAVEPIPIVKEKAIELYDRILNTVSPTGILKRYLSKKVNNIYDYMLKLHKSINILAQKGMLKLGEIYKDGKEIAKDKFNFLTQILPESIKSNPIVQAILNNEHVKRITGNIKNIFGTLAKGFVRNVKEVATEGKDLFVSEEGKFKVPGVGDLAKFGKNAFFGTAVKTGHDLRTAYKNIGGLGLNTARLGLSGLTKSKDLIGMETNINVPSLSPINAGKKIREGYRRAGELGSETAGSVLGFLKEYITGNKQKEDKKDSELKESIEESSNKTVEAIKELKPQFSQFDKDKDGLREGSWQERLMAVNKKKENKPDVTKTSSKDKDRDKEDKKGFDWTKLLLAVGGIAPAIIGKLTSVGELFTGTFTSMISWLGKTLLSGITALPELLSSPFKLLGKAKNVLFGSSKTGLKTASKTVSKKATGKIISAITKKAGLKIAGKAAFKVASRAVPVLGWGLAAWDAVNIGKKMLVDGKSFKSSLSEQILGVDITDDAKKRKEAWKADGDVDGETPPKETKVSKTGSTKVGKLPIATGPMADSVGGERYLTPGKNVNIDGFNPALKQNLYGMASEYYEETGKTIPINSGYRSRKEQEKLRKKYGSKAAVPGRSLHEYGLAFDTNTSTANKLDELGLSRKYGFTRPVGEETWHVEPAGIQEDIPGAKRDPMYASELIMAGAKGGGSGWGLNDAASKYSRNKDYQLSLMGAISYPVDKEKSISSSPSDKNDNTEITKKQNIPISTKDTSIAPELYSTADAVNYQRTKAQTVVSQNSKEELRLLHSDALDTNKLLNTSVGLQSSMVKLLTGIYNVNAEFLARMDDQKSTKPVLEEPKKQKAIQYVEQEYPANKAYEVKDF